MARKGNTENQEIEIYSDLFEKRNEPLQRLDPQTHERNEELNMLKALILDLKAELERKSRKLVEFESHYKHNYEQIKKKYNETQKEVP